MDSTLRQQYEDFLNPAIQRPRLLRAAVFIACFEAFKVSFLDKGKQFFTDSKNNLSPDYQKEIVSKHKYLTQATLLWFKSVGAVNDTDIGTFEEARRRRNELAHRLLDLLDRGLPADLDTVFQEMVAVMRKIEIWWIREMEFPEELEGKEVPDEQITPGLELAMRLVHDVALGDTEQAREYLAAFQKMADEHTKRVQE